MTREKIDFCVRLGNPVPCHSIDTLEQIAELGYIETYHRYTKPLQIQPVVIYITRSPFCLLLEQDRIPFAEGDILVRESYRLLVPRDYQSFYSGNSTDFREYTLS